MKNTIKIMIKLPDYKIELSYLVNKLYDIILIVNYFFVTKTQLYMLYTDKSRKEISNYIHKEFSSQSILQDKERFLVVFLVFPRISVIPFLLFFVFVRSYCSKNWVALDSTVFYLFGEFHSTRWLANWTNFHILG